jgi:hypothetical protein
MKLLITEACTIAGPEQSQHADVGDVVDVHSKDEALLLVRMGRARYLERNDDPTKGTLTATADDKAIVAQRVEAIQAEREARDLAAQAQSPAGLAALVATSVAQAVQAALAPRNAKGS